MKTVVEIASLSYYKEKQYFTSLSKSDLFNLCIELIGIYKMNRSKIEQYRQLEHLKNIKLKRLIRLLNSITEHTYSKEVI